MAPTVTRMPGCACWSSAAWSQAKPGATRKIILGQSVPLTGAASEIGLAFAAGAKLYVDAFNARKNNPGWNFELRQLDDGYDPAKATANAKKLLDDGADVLFELTGEAGVLRPVAGIVDARCEFVGEQPAVLRDEQLQREHADIAKLVREFLRKVHGVLEHLLEHRGGPLDDLAGGDLVDEMVGEEVDGHGGFLGGRGRIVAAGGPNASSAPQVQKRPELSCVTAFWGRHGVGL